MTDNKHAEAVARMVATLNNEMQQSYKRDWYPVHRDYLRAILDAAALNTRPDVEAIANALPDEIDLFRAIRDAKARGYAASAKAAYARIAPVEAAIRSIPVPTSGEGGADHG